jgi:hypothetical protein
MTDVLKSAARYTLYAALVGVTLQGLAVLLHAGGTAASDALRLASTVLAAG